MDSSPFHSGEVAAQERAGLSAAGAGIRTFMPDQHRIFFGHLPYLFLGAIDPAGWPIASILAGPPGFIESPDERTLRIEARPLPADPAAGLVASGASVGLLGLDLATRRRNRANGSVTAVGDGGFTVAVEQSFGNCPQYIQARQVHAGGMIADAPVEALTTLSGRARDLVAAADTLFVATRAGAGIEAHGGVDISHRGGRPGFVRIDGDRLTIPDFRGNRYFNTLGNLVTEPRAALLFVDFERGDVLQLQGRTEINWSGPEVAAFEGAERLWRFDVARGWFRPAALPLRWSFDSYAPTTERTGLWRQ
jgi:uncharacterized protein